MRRTERGALPGRIAARYGISGELSCTSRTPGVDADVIMMKTGF